MILELIETRPYLATATALLALSAVAWLSNFIVKSVLLRVLDRILSHTRFGRDPELRRQGVVERLANIVPALVISTGIALVPHLPPDVAIVVRNVAHAFILLTAALAISAALNIVDILYHRRPEGLAAPIKGYVQVAKIAIYVIAVLLMIAILVDRSPLILLSGLGAMAAVLILVFQDTLLSLVAGIQISSTDMVRVGDWVEIPAQDADGAVIEIALHTVKVQNWDKTITTVPIRKLVTDSFKNWRGMQESGGRRIKRAIYLDQTSIRFLTGEDHERLGAIAHLAEYLERKQAEITAWNRQLGERGKIPANTRRTTNIGTFRAYVENYLRSHPGVHQEMSLMVRQLPPSSEGLPLEIYCFANTVVWVDYEAIQSDIFDHLYAILPEFDLRVFQNPSGRDLQLLAAERAEP